MVVGGLGNIAGVLLRRRVSAWRFGRGCWGVAGRGYTFLSAKLVQPSAEACLVPAALGPGALVLYSKPAIKE